MIIPHSSICTDRMRDLSGLLTQKSLLWMSTFGIRPSKLFIGVDQRLAIYFLTKSNVEKVYNTNYYKWYENNRNTLFNCISYIKIELLSSKKSIPKIGNALGKNIWNKITKTGIVQSGLIGKNNLYYHNAPRYWIRALKYIPYFWNELEGNKISSHIKSIKVNNEENKDIFTAILNSSIYYWWYIVLSNCRDLTLREINNFHFDLEKIADISGLKRLTNELMTDYENNKFRKNTYYKTTGKVIYDEYYPKKSKSIIDEIDKVLAEHYGFTQEELDFIINYDIKYRMGKELGNG